MSEEKLTEARYYDTDDWYTDFFVCGNCESRNIPLGAKFCSNCGAEIDPDCYTKINW
jgi:predicted amidophosphoribosyltransferase